MNYSYILHTPEGERIIAEDINPFLAAADEKVTVEPFHIQITNQMKNGYCLTEITVSSEAEAQAYVSVLGEGEAEFYSFTGLCEVERLYRQSPHNPENDFFKMEKSAVPMVAAVAGGQADILISDNPSFFDNATTQHILPQKQQFYLSSGDKGGAPNFPESDPFGPIFHTINADNSHTFRFIAFRKAADSLKTIRRAAYVAIEKVFGTGSDSVYRAMCFASNYMHVRKNERGNSDKWIVAGIEYGNMQYFRDSFYQTWILGAEIEEQSYKALTYNTHLSLAEHSLIYMIWSYRLILKGRAYDEEKAAEAFYEIKRCMDKHPDGGFYADTDRAEDTYKNWFDICAFADDEQDTYNLCLLICALEAAKRMGFDIEDRKERALKRLKTLFTGTYFKLSDVKDCMCMDFAVGDVLHYMLFNETFIDDEMVKKSYRAMVDGPAKTPYGIKIVAMADGDYVPYEMYESNGKVFPLLKNCEPGRYFNGGSYHVYEMIFHICAYLHGVEDAEQNMTARLMIDLDYDGATHEYMHTVRGFGGKPNQGWNAVIYAFWEELVKRGKATTAYFEAAEAKLASLE